VLQNRPNPFTGTTELRIGLLSESNVSIEVYDVAGRRVRVQSLGTQSAGWNAIPFDGRDDAGRPLASGVYFYRVTANGTTVTHKMVITK
jgi:flagellar hook assembly protein FlgD